VTGGTIGCSQVNKRLGEYGKAVEELVQANYRLLAHEKVSAHGRRMIMDRPSFFGGLYEWENLKKSKFKYLNRVGAFLKSKEYRMAKPFYMLNGKKLNREPVKPAKKLVEKTTLNGRGSAGSIKKVK